MTGSLTGTTAQFQDMLNEYLPNALLREEMKKRDYFLTNVEKDNTWKGGSLIVPFKGAGASTIKLGGLASSADINQSRFVRGQIDVQPEVWGSLIFNEKDIMRNGKVDAQSLIAVLPDTIDDFMEYMKQCVSLQFTNGPIFASATASGTASGIVVDRIERFVVGQPAVLKSSTIAALKFWVKQVDINTKQVQLSSTMDLAAAVDLSAYVIGDAPVFYFDGGETAANQFTALKDSLLSATNGGSATLYGQTKLAYPYTQAVNINAGAAGVFGAWTQTNFLENIFKSQIIVRNIGKGMPNKIVMSYQNLGWALIALDLQKGAYRQAGDTRVSQYGWTEIDIMGPEGMLTLVAVQEMDNDFMAILDLKALKIYSNGFFRKRKGPDGLEYFTIRDTDGYKYILDTCFFGDMVLQRPSRCGIIFNISISLS